MIHFTDEPDLAAQVGINVFVEVILFVLLIDFSGKDQIQVKPFGNLTGKVGCLFWIESADKKVVIVFLFSKGVFVK